MVINISVQHSGGLLPDIMLLTQGYYQWGTRLNTLVPCSGFVFIAFVMYITTTMCDGVYYIVSGLFSMFFWCPCRAINVNVHYNGGLLPTLYCGPNVICIGEPV